ncbi:MAG: hypothetical protein LBH08_03060 [Puniceicoccales bacterium]|jgi:hypothetical protein|nr:hypothetical protein [Puniceicoccales bacterium]
MIESPPSGLLQGVTESLILIYDLNFAQVSRVVVLKPLPVVATGIQIHEDKSFGEGSRST